MLSRLSDVVRARPLESFFVLAYVVTWVLWAPMVIGGVPVFSGTTYTPSLAALPGVAIGVTGSAFAVTALTQGRAGVRRLVQRILHWRVPLRWYVVALLMIPLLEFLFTTIFVGPEMLNALTPTALMAYPAAFAGHFIFGPLFEETGWRGFALPRLQHQYGPMGGTLLLGLLWCGWHIFLYVPHWIHEGTFFAAIGVVLFMAFTISISISFTWLSNNTGGSLLLVMLLHGSVNGTATYVQVLAHRNIISDDAAAFCAGFGALFAALTTAAVICWVTRRQLSYPRYRYEAEHRDLGRPVTATMV